MEKHCHWLALVSMSTHSIQLDNEQTFFMVIDGSTVLKGPLHALCLLFLFFFKYPRHLLHNISCLVPAFYENRARSSRSPHSTLERINLKHVRDFKSPEHTHIQSCIQQVSVISVVSICISYGDWISVIGMSVTFDTLQFVLVTLQHPRDQPPSIFPQCTKVMHYSKKHICYLCR